MTDTMKPPANVALDIASRYVAGGRGIRLAREIADAINGGSRPVVTLAYVDMPSGAKWQYDIHDGPGFHGIGETKAEALMNAALAWRQYEAEDGDQ